MLQFLKKNKYEVLLIALIAHLYDGAFFHDHHFYVQFIWPINMLLLGLASIGIFAERGKWTRRLRNSSFLIVFFIPILVPFIGESRLFWNISGIAYALFFSLIFIEVLRFLIKPCYINTDIISGAACGYFLLIEIGVFISFLLINNYPDAYNGIDSDSAAHAFLDIVYFNTITISSIGYGDISPSNHAARLSAAFLGVVGQFYSVVLVGIIISKYTTSDL